MKWYWLCSRDARLDLFLLHDYDGRDTTSLLPRFSGVRRCRGCGKFDEEQLLQIGFDPDRQFKLNQDLFAWPNDINFTIVTENFRRVVDESGIHGVSFIRCGQTNKSIPLYVLVAEHRSHCRDANELWLPRGYSKPQDKCNVCHRMICTVGHPALSAIDLPDPLTISIPDIPTEMGRSRDERFFCSEEVRRIFKERRLKGCDYARMDD